MGGGMMKTVNEYSEGKIITIFAIVSVIVVLSINAISLYSINKIHQTTEEIYKHPLKVSNAALMLQKGVLKIHRDMKDVVLSSSDEELHIFVVKVDKEEKDVYKNLEIIQKNILGKEGLALEEETYVLFKNWKSIRDNVIKLVDDQKYKEAIAITKNRGANHVRKLEASSLKLYKYARNKADDFQENSHKIFNNFNRINILLNVVAIVLFMFFIFYIRARIRNYLTLIRENEKKLQELNTQYTLAIEGTNDGLWDWNLEKEEIYFSPRWKAMLGYKDDELENSFETWESRVHPDDLENAEKEIALAHANPDYQYRTVHRLRHKDGSWVWILDRGTTLFNEEGEAIRMVGFHTDITIEKELEAKLQESNNTFELFMQNTQTNVFIAEDGVILYANPNAKNFFKEEQLTGLHIEDVVSEEEALKMNYAINQALEKGKFEVVFPTKNYKGEEKIFHQLFFAMEKEKKKVGLISIDITKEKLQEEAFKKQEEIMIAQSRHAAMGEMISMIAHQWRQPISVIAMDANNILADIELDMLETQELLETSKDIIAQTQELSKTIDDFREFFKPDKVPEKVTITRVVEDAIAIVGKSLENNGIALRVEVDEADELTTFSRELMQVLINIIKNAKEAFADEKSESKLFMIKSTQIEEKITLSLCDNAGGIEPKILDKIFNPYFTTKSAKNGTGLGLYMSKTIIEKHLQGSIEVSNSSDGCCFEISLPNQLTIENADKKEE